MSAPMPHSAPLFAALDYCRRGFSVIPISTASNGGKKPLLAWEQYQKRRATEQEIQTWWEQWPDANVGIVTGAVSGVVVLDADGAEGEASALALLGVESNGTPSTKTGKGCHRLYKHPGRPVNNRVRIKPGLDVRGDGGYIVAPPSQHENGESYTWLTGLEQPLAPLPVAVASLLNRAASGAIETKAVGGKPIRNGGRNQALYTLGRSLHAKGMSPEAIRAALEAENKARCAPPLDSAELAMIIRQAIKQADRPDFTPPAERAQSSDGGSTDFAYAVELARKAGQHLRYCSDQGQWFAFDGARWVPGTADQVVPYVVELAKERYRRAAQADDPDVRKRLAKEARKLETTSSVHQIIGMAQTLPALRTETSDFNHDAFLLNVANGTLDLKTGRLLPHRREDLLTRLIPVEYDPQAEAPVFAAFLSSLFAGHRDLVTFLQRAVGYSLTGSVKEQVFFLCWGEGSNGKSTLFNLLLHLLGDYAAKMAASTLLAKRGGGDSAAMNDMATLQGARFVSTVESDMGKRLAEASVKELTGGDRIKVKRLYRDVFSIDPTWKIWVATNHKPIIRGRDHAMWRRIRLIPFTVTVPDDEQDRSLPAKLLTELPGVLRWAVEGCLAWQRDGLGLPQEVRAATEDYREEMDDLSDFLEECCVVAEPDAWDSTDRLYSAFTAWAKESGEFQWSKRAFTQRLTEAGFPPKTSKDGTKRGRAGIRLLRSGEPLGGRKADAGGPSDASDGKLTSDSGNSPREVLLEKFTQSDAIYRQTAATEGESGPVDVDTAIETYRRNYEGER